MTNEYVETKGGWVVLDVNNKNTLRIAFENIPMDHMPKFEGKEMTYVTIDKGLAYYGMYDANGKRWSSRAGVINAKHNVDIVDVTAIVHNGAFALALTKEFAEYLLEKYKLPFHYEIGTDDIHERRWVLVQNDSDALIGRVVSDSNGFDCKVLDHYIRCGGQSFKVEYADGNIRYLTFKNLSGAYWGIDHKTFMEELDKLISR